MITSQPGIREYVSTDGARRDLICIGASAGGVQGLLRLVQDLPKNLSAAILIVLHTSPDSPGLLANILNRVGTLPAINPADGEPITPGYIYVAPPDYHMIVEDSVLRLTRGPRENNFRPAVDPLFRSAAVARGACVVGVILSGGLDDGTYGLIRIKERGGVAVVQDPAEALVAGMPESAIRNTEIDHILPISEMAPLLKRLTSEPCVTGRGTGGAKRKQPEVGRDAQPIPEGQTRDSREQKELEEAAQTDPSKLLDQHPIVGEPTTLTCPECGGVMSEKHAGNSSRFLCHIGHAYFENSLEAAKLNGVEGALWTAVRILKEAGSMYDLMARRARERNRPAMAARFEKRLDESRQRAQAILGILIRDQEKPVARTTAQPDQQKRKSGAKAKGTKKAVKR